MIKNTLIFSAFLMLIQSAFAQKPYFQQEANYKISASLDDKQHRLTANLELTYKNNSGDPLSIIYLLLPANAYSSQRSAFAKQELEKGKTRFYFADAKAMGGFSDLNIQVDGKRVEVEIDKNNPDVAKVKLVQPILAGDSIKITTPFQYKIPAIFSRGGHAGQQYLMTQWYPRIAVYDRAGWHPQPYLDQGEFYAEFGTFDVTLTLPENYVVGATGVLETPSERVFLAKKAADTEGVFLAKNSKIKSENRETAAEKIAEGDTVPASSERLKTIRYTAERVIDFAWFADKKFMVLRGDTVLKSGRNIETYTYFSPKFAELWEKSIFYTNRAIGFYSEHVGEYPHPQASAVMADEGFGGGMEYPMITVLSGEFSAKSLDETIAHEVGHNWFQGILATNEREHPWMDEGLNSYYDHLYTAEYYGKVEWEDYGVPNFVAKGTDAKPMGVFTQSQFFRRKDQAPETPATDLTPSNYLLAAYEKPAMSLAILAKQVGQDKFEELMQKYFTEWQFKHPQPADFKKIWTDDSLNIGAVSWFFDGMINSTEQTDYKITDLKQDEKYWKATVKNVGKVAAPFTVSGVKGDSAIYTVRIGGVPSGEQTVVYIPKKEGISMITVDFRHLLPDVNRSNNNVKTRGLLPKWEPLRVKFLAGLDNSRKTNLYVTPIIGANIYDQLMLGAWLHNGALPLKSLEWSVAPVYSLGSKSLAGLGSIGYNFFKGKNKIHVGVSVRSFAFENNLVFKATRIYDKIAPSVSVDFGDNVKDKFTSKLQLRSIFIGEEAFVYDDEKKYIGKKRNTNALTELTYSGLLKNALGNSSFKTALEQQSYVDGANRKQNYLRLTVEGKKDFMYQRNRLFSARVFVGGFLNNTRRDGANLYGDNRGSIGLVSNSFTDYRYDGIFMARNTQIGSLSQQIDPNTEGGMKFVLPANSQTIIGFSNDFVASLNLKMDLPVNLPQFLKLKPYFDVGYFSDKRPLASDQTLLMSGGIAWEILGEAVAVYFPVYFNGNSGNPNSFAAYAVTQRGRYLKRVSFSLDLRKANPLAWMKKLLDF